jgi:hypothetical protein
MTGQPSLKRQEIRVRDEALSGGVIMHAPPFCGDRLNSETPRVNEIII